MSNLFKQAKSTSQSSLSPEQRALLGPLSEFINSRLGQPVEGVDQLASQLLSSGSDQSKAMAERMFSEALLGPALTQFDRQVAPRISESFASVGGTLSSRRGSTLAQSLTDVTSNATGQLAGLLPQIQSFPLQQTLAQIQGLSGIQALEYNPYQQALAFALQPTQQVAQQQAGQGWGILGSLIGAGGAIGAGALTRGK